MNGEGPDDQAPMTTDDQAPMTNKAPSTNAQGLIPLTEALQLDVPAWMRQRPRRAERRSDATGNQHKERVPVPFDEEYPQADEEEGQGQYHEPREG